MLSVFGIFSGRSQLRARIHQVTTRASLDRGQVAASLFTDRLAPSGPEPRVYFAVRSLVSRADGHLLQYGVAGAGGEPLLQVCVHACSPALEAEEDEPAAPDVIVGEAALTALLLARCAGRRMVAFHRGLQAGLLPPPVVAAARGFACAWRRHGLDAGCAASARSAPPANTLHGACVEAGVAPPASAAALDRAQAIARLWERLEAPIMSHGPGALA